MTYTSFVLSWLQSKTFQKYKIDNLGICHVKVLSYSKASCNASVVVKRWDASTWIRCISATCAVTIETWRWKVWPKQNVLTWQETHLLTAWTINDGYSSFSFSVQWNSLLRSRNSHWPLLNFGVKLLDGKAEATDDARKHTGKDVHYTVYT